MRCHFKNLDSTSKYAKENISNLNDFDYVTCDYQNNGYGVSGSWDGEGRNVYYTIVFNQCIADEQTLPFVILLSIVEVIKKYISDMYIKLPNDIYYKSKKLSGFIIEKKENSFVIGIGINVNDSDDQYTSFKKINNENYDLNLIYEELTNKIECNLNLEKEVLLNNIKHYIKIIGNKVRFINKHTLEESEDVCLDINFQEIKFKNHKIEIVKYKQLDL